MAAQAEAKVALDPSVVGVGARALGMGRAFVAAAGEPDSVFLNPAALNDLSRWGATSMYSKLISEVDYIMLGGAVPTPAGKLGLGFLGASIGGLQSATIDPGTGLITFEPGTFNYYNNAYFLTYGTELLANLSVGGNFKFFSQGYSNGRDTGSGFDADLGLLFRPSGALSFGFLQRNFLPASLGAKISWQSGEAESLATSTRLGVSYCPGDFCLNADYEFFPTISQPGLLKLGAEYWLTPAFAVRCGSDQDAQESNLTAGLSFLASGYKFDYAYHQYGNISTNVTHTFSISYGIFREKAFEEKKEYIKISAPENRSLAFTDMVTVEGLIMPEVKRLEAQDKEVVPDGRGGFQYLQPLVLGKNSIKFKAYNEVGEPIEEKSLRLLRLQSFTDVPEDHWARVPIAIMAMTRISSGYPDGGFRPEGSITRAELCSMLAKARPSLAPPRASTGFKDVPAKHWAAAYISQAVAEGAVKGYPGGKFKPNGQVTRAEGISIIARFARAKEAGVLEAPFPDVPGRFWAAKEILAAREAGLLKYLEGQNFEPKKKLTRAEVAEILSKSEMMSAKVNELLDFERGY